MVVEPMLGKAGFEVFTAGGGKEGVELYGKHMDEISAVVLDLTMPGMDGVETFKAIRGLRKDAVVVLFSGYSESEATRRFEGLGLSGFVQKPFKSRELTQAVRDAIDKAKA